MTGAGRRVGIGCAVAQRVACDGFDVTLNRWTPYDQRSVETRTKKPTSMSLRISHAMVVDCGGLG